MSDGSQQSGTALVTVSHIAELAGVSPSAVSNWRKRFDDFPSPYERGEGGRDLFRLDLVNVWLEKTGRETIQPRAADSVWLAIEPMRGVSDSADGIEVACAALAARRVLSSQTKLANLADLGSLEDSLPALLVSAGLSDHLSAAFDPLVRAGPSATRLISGIDSIPPRDTGEVVEAILARRDRGDRYARGASTTSEVLRSLVGGLAIPAEGDLIFDPAAGEGGFLLASGLSGSEVRLAGQELSERAWRLSVLRLLAHGLRADDLRQGDSLREDLFPDLRADLIVCDPPYGLRDWGAEAVGGDPRWEFGLPSGRDADMAWLQHVIHHLAPGGRGFVLLPASSLFRDGREARVRRELLRRGALDAVVGLPRGLADGTSLSLAIWVVRPPAAGTGEPAPVLFVDAAGGGASAGSRERKQRLPRDVEDAIVDTFRRWRDSPAAVEGNPGFASWVGVPDLLADDEAVLVPTRWVGRPAVSSGEVVGEIGKYADNVRSSLSKVRATPDLPLRLPVAETGDGRPAIRIADLPAEGLATILRASRITTEDYRETGTPVLTQAALSKGTAAVMPTRFVNVGELRKPPVLTEPNDIVLGTIGDAPFAVVIEEGGLVLGGSLQALRFHGDWYDPYVAAACLNAPQTAEMAGGVAVRHVKLKDLRLPNLSQGQAAALRALLDHSSELGAAATELAEALRDLREAVVEGVVTEAIEVSTPSSGGAV